MAEWRLEETTKETLATKQRIKARGLDEKNFCLVPFTTIILEPDGQVGMCRHKGSNFPIGNILNNSIAEIWNGEKARQWRREFLEGKPGFCATEVRHRHCQHCPENNKLLDYIELSEVQTKPILKLTANFNGKCNLQCQMCDIWQKPNGLYDQINFWEPAKKEIFPHLKEVDLLSGEPFIQTDTYRLINEISEVNPLCQWIFTTNAHWKLTDKIKADLNKIHIKNIIISLDSFDAEVYHKIRYPGKLDFVLKNIEALLAYNEERKLHGLSDIRFILNFLTQKDNWSELSYAIEFCEKKGVIPLMTYLYVPSQFSLNTLPDDERMDVFTRMLDSLNSQQVYRTMRVLMPLLDSLRKIDRVAALYHLDEKLKR
jgi:radical SAM protein with 4Fe4S-binding SPASM domain